ncbi:MAG: Hsp70 family protein [Bacteroidetes bacterium]|nr:Hsp70 family protein [Bacteroidota bacterium]
MKTINFGIDLGTTNSLIARYSQGKTEVFKNPVGFKETLPSCVAFRGERIIVGDKAREWVQKDPLNVFSAFKRKMGTGEKYFIPAKLESISAIELSAMVLRELKNFIYSGENPESMVITIPASFDTVQSNATKQAGYQAGFKEVVLLQEPIAASLSFFNNRAQIDQGKWLVYDLGGGTFDAAIIEVVNGEMKVLDHQGDNFLGGVDIDHIMVTELLIPKLIELSGKPDLADHIATRNGPYERLYYILLQKAEECKKELSSQLVSEIDFTFEIPGEAPMDIFMEIPRSEFEILIDPIISNSTGMIAELLERNELESKDISEIILIGGSTLIPLVREKLESEFEIPLNYSVDPTNAVAIGAAYYAGTKMARLEEKTEEQEQGQEIPDAPLLEFKLAYNNSTRDNEEYVKAVILGKNPAVFYRILRQDGGYDSGLKQLKGNDFGEFVSLREQTVNVFHIRFYDENQNEIKTGSNKIEITQGLYSLYGQPLPEDICLEVDDLENNTTICELVFKRNSILPLSKTIYKEISRTIKTGEKDSIIINLLEGDHTTHPNANKIIGVIEIANDKLNGQVVRGSEVEIKIEISESRDVHVNATILFTNQEFSEVFSPTEKYVSISKLKEEIIQLRDEFEIALHKAADDEDFENAQHIMNSISDLDNLQKDALKLRDGDLTDTRYQLEEQKRKIAKHYYNTRGKNTRVQSEMMEYTDSRNAIRNWLDTIDDIPEDLHKRFDKITEKEHDILKSNSYFLIKSQNNALNRLAWRMILKSAHLTTTYFHIYAEKDETEFTNYSLAKKAISRGEKALDRQNFIELSSVLSELMGLSKSSQAEYFIKGTGLG